MSVNYEFLNNLTEKKLYNLWCRSSFKQYIEEYLNFSTKIDWNEFTDNIKIDNTFIEIFQHKFTVQCCICKNKSLYTQTRLIKEYSTWIDYKFSHICLNCDNKYKIIDCDKCYGENISGITHCADDSCKEYIQFICCVPPNINDTCHHCIHKNGRESHRKLFCMIHIQKNILPSDCDCSILCRKCFNEIQDEYNLNNMIDSL